MKPRSRKARTDLIARKAVEQERIREIHSALGGSAEAFDDVSVRPPDEEVSLGSRIDAYIELQTTRQSRASAPEPSLRMVEPPSLSVAVPPPAPAPLAPPPPAQAPWPAHEPLVFALRGPSALSRASTAVAWRARPAASGVVRACRGSARGLVHAVLATARRLAAVAQLVARAAHRLLHILAARRSRSARPVRSHEVRREPERLRPEVLQQLQGYTRPVADDAAVAVVPPAPTPAPRPPSEPRLAAPRGPSVLSRASAVPVRRAASGLVRACRASARVLVHVVFATARRLAVIAKFVTRTARRLLRTGAVRQSRSARPVSSREQRREPGRLPPAVVQRVQGYTPSVAGDAPVAVAPDPEPEPEPVAPPSAASVAARRAPASAAELHVEPGGAPAMIAVNRRPESRPPATA